MSALAAGSHTAGRVVLAEPEVLESTAALTPRDIDDYISRLDRWLHSRNGLFADQLVNLQSRLKGPAADWIRDAKAAATWTTLEDVYTAMRTGLVNRHDRIVAEKEWADAILAMDEVPSDFAQRLRAIGRRCEEPKTTGQLLFSRAV